MTKSSFGLIFGLSILVIVVLAGLYLLRPKGPDQSQSQNKTTTTTMTQSAPQPGVNPVTSANVEQTLNNTDTQMQQSINQANSDLQEINNIDKTQDSTNGL